MEEKAKNKTKIAEKKTSILIYFLSFMVLSCCICESLFLFFSEIKPHLDIRDCSQSQTPVEWTGVVEFADASESEILITEENAMRLELLDSINLQIESPMFHMDATIKHPQHDYVLTFNDWGSGSDGTNRLVVCPNNYWASHVLSDYAGSMAFTPDGRYFALSYNKRHETSLIMYDAYSIQEFGRLALGDANVKSFAFHPTESLVAITLGQREEARLEIWNYESQTLLASYPFQSGWVNFLAFNTEGTLLAVEMGSRSGNTNFWGIPPE
jgi:WD40 repeat protein